MINIGIIGLGGVGGYLAAMLSSYYQNDNEVHISVFARGEAAKVIKRDGLTLKKRERTINTHPYAVYETGGDIEVMDYLFVCVKSYSVESIIESIRGSVGENSVIIPFQNGVEGRDKLIDAFPNNYIIDGCVYIMSRIESPGVIVENGIEDKIGYYYGDVKGENSNLSQLQSILSAAYHQIFLVDDITERVWAKFSRISTLSTIQTYYGMCSGELVESNERIEELATLVREFAAVALAMGHRLRADIVDTNIDFAKITPAKMTTSMQRDVYEGKLSEIEGQCGYIVRKGEELSVDTPLYKKMYYSIIERYNITKSF